MFASDLMADDASVCVFSAVMVARHRPYGLPIVSSVRVSLISMNGGFGIDLKQAKRCNSKYE